MKLRPKPHTPEEREAINNFFMPLTMSIWENPQFGKNDDQQYDNATSKFMSQRLKEDGSSTTVKLIDLQYQLQPEDKNENFKDADGKAYVFYFEDEQGREVTYETPKKNNMFFKAMRDNNVQPGEKITITRKGLQFDTEYVVTRPGADGEFAPPAVSQIAPF